MRTIRRKGCSVFGVQGSGFRVQVSGFSKSLTGQASDAVQRNSRSRSGDGVALRPPPHHSLLTTHHSPLPTHHSPLTRLLLPSLLLLLMLPAMPGRAAALPEDERRFLWDKANTAMAHARTPSEFSAAARHYETLAAAGIQNGTLFYNLGTALLQAGRFDEARRALERAERYEGAAPDIRRNLLAAYSGAQKNRRPDLPWDRSVFVWHYALPCDMRALLAAASFSFAWLLMTLGRAVQGARVRWPVLLAFAASFALATSVLTTILSETHPLPSNLSSFIP